jgi:hypothetical protein
MALLSHAVGRTERLSAWNEVFALVLLFAGTLLFFALISYTPKDIPSWLWFSHVSPANHPAQNFIGPLGAIVAGICYQLIGVFASLLLAAVLLGFGAAKIVLSSIAFRTPNPVDRFVPHLRVRASTKPGGSAISSAGQCRSTFKGRVASLGYRFSDENRGLLPAALGPVGSVLLVVGFI